MYSRIFHAPHRGAVARTFDRLAEDIETDTEIADRCGRKGGCLLFCGHTRAPGAARTCVHGCSGSGLNGSRFAPSPPTDLSSGERPGVRGAFDLASANAEGHKAPLAQPSPPCEREGEGSVAPRVAMRCIDGVMRALPALPAR